MDENDLNELKYIFSYLVDSFSYEIERDKKALEIENTAKELENEKKSIESLKNGISDNINTFINVYNNFKPYGEANMSRDFQISRMLLIYGNNWWARKI